MKNHVRVYLKFWGYAVSPMSQEKVLCDGCEANFANDIHHLSRRGSGGSKKKDTPENLVALCRNCHILCESFISYNDKVKAKLKKKIKRKESWLKII
tara:strand:- start:983 stop:1273 length:291 start_codon:yes stop_codon:yes gene_type:complete